jgi:hypothetical protein
VYPKNTIGLGIEKVAKRVAHQQSSVSCKIFVEIFKQDALSSVAAASSLSV